jgi:hypothetical protein
MDEQACQASANAVQPEMVLEPYQMIIQMDAWNIRERDGWGQTERLRRVGGGQVTHFMSIGNAKRKRTEKCGFIGGFEGFGGDEGKRRLLNADCWPGAGTRTSKLDGLPNAALSARANIGASKGTKRYWVWKRSGEITAGTCFFLITAIWTHLKTEDLLPK